MYTATIHAFCLRHFLRPYFWASDGYKKGFEIAPPDSEAYRAHAFAALEGARLPRSALEQVEQAGRRMDGTSTVTGGAIEVAIRDFWKRMRSDGLIDFATLLYESVRISRRLPAVSRGVASRYAWVLVDEFQDTTEVQLEILSLIAECRRSRFMIVGDPNQSIFRFAGARPEYFDRLATKLEARSDVSFSVNFRSSQHIVEVAEAVIPRTPPMRAVGGNKDFSLRPAWIECASAEAAIIGTILPELRKHGIALGQTAVLSPWFGPLYRLGRELYRRGIPVVGPGARPYRRRCLVVSTAECLAACATVGHAGSAHWVSREVADLLRQVSLDSSVAGESHALGPVVTALIRDARRIARARPNAGEWFQAIAEAAGDRLSEVGLVSASERARIVNSGTEVVEDPAAEGGLSELTVECLAEFVRPTNHVQLLTVHRSKGREFEAVVLIDAHHRRFPYGAAPGPNEIEDGRRLFYVAVTRAHKALYILTGHSGSGLAPTMFLTEGDLPLRRIAE